MLSRRFAHSTKGLRPAVVQLHIRRAATGPAYQPPTPAAQQEPPNPHRAFYKNFGLPVTKVFLGALLTYQVLMWSWLKLESIESNVEGEAEIKRLESQVEALKGHKKEVKG